MITILTEQDIINTYDKRQQEQCRLYFEYKKIKKENPDFGYKKISKILGQTNIAKTRWWHCGKYNPVPVQTVNWLKERSLIPLVSGYKDIELIAKVLGTTFGDGGIFGNLNAIFLSSMELEAVKEFGEDLKKLFGNEIEENSRIIEGGIWGHSWCYQNTNHNVIRFFKALGAPIGDKSLTKLEIPNWINLSEEIKNEFFGSFFGNELSTPKVHPNLSQLTDLSLGISATDKFAENRIYFLSQIGCYLKYKGINVGSICTDDHKKTNRYGEPTKIYKLLISKTFENVTNFIVLTKINYCKHKKEKLARTMNKFSEIKRNKIKALISKGYSENRYIKLLNLTPAALEIIENYENFHEIYEEEASLVKI